MKTKGEKDRTYAEVVICLRFMWRLTVT